MTAPVSTTAVKTQQPAKASERSKERKRRGPAKDPASRILELQRVVGNRAVNQLMQPGSGFPLAPDVRTFMEERFNYDFSRVRIHTDRRAAAFSHALGAQAYTVGHDIAFGTGQFDPSTLTGRTLLVHELAHVVQANGRIPSQFEITPAADATEIQAERAAVAIGQGGHAQISGGRSPAIRLRRDPDLTTRLEKLEAFGGHPEEIGFSVSEVIDSIFAMLRGIDLGDPDNLQPITETIGKYYPRSVLSGFLQRIEDVHRVRKAAAEARHQSAMRLMQVQRRGPYGTLGPGVALPVIAGVFKPLLELWEAIEYAFKSAGAFVRGLVEGFSKSVSEDQARKLSERLLESAVLNIVFPPVFLSGALVGIVEDVVDTVKGIYHVIVNFREMASAAIELMSALFSKDGPRISRALGLEIGKEYANRITGMLKGNLFEFTYDLGKFIGPTIIYAILSALGFPELLAASIVTRIISILKPFLKRFPTLVRVAKKVASKLPQSRRKHNIDPDLDDTLGGQDLPGASPQSGQAGGKAVAGGTDPGQSATSPVGNQPSAQSTSQGANQPPASSTPKGKKPVRNVYPDFEDIPANMIGTAQNQVKRLSSQLGHQIPENRVLSAPWIGRIRDKGGKTRSASTSQGWLRNESRFWNKWKESFPEDAKLLGPGNTVTSELAQKYGWPTSGPNNAVGQKLIHHHIDNGSYTVAIPRSWHEKMSKAIHAVPEVLGTP